VREIWDGHRVVRQTGGCQTVELTYDPTWTHLSMSDASKFGEGKKSVVSLEESLRVRNGFIMAKEGSGHFNSRKAVLGDDFRGLSADEAESVVYKKAPNMTLNIGTAIPPTTDAFYFMCLGLFVQVLVAVINGLAVYRWRWLRAGRVVASYGYPVWAVGTCSITVGVALCARVVQGSTTEYRLDPIVLQESLRVLRIQSKIPSLSLPAYAILDAEGNQTVRMTKRNDWPPTRGNKAERESRLILTVVGTCLTLGGFVCQNVGTRELHFSAGLLQLGATLILAALRGWLRRNVGDSPDPEPMRLSESFGASHVASILEDSGCCMLSETMSKSDSTFHRAGIEEHLKEDILKKKSIPNSERPQNVHEDDFCQVQQVYRMLNSQSELSNFEPDSDEVVKLASNLCAAFERTIGVFKKELDESSDFEWIQHMLLFAGWNRESSLSNNPAGPTAIRAIVGISLSASAENLRGGYAGSTRRLLQAIISLTCCYYEHPTKKENPVAIFIVGSCNRKSLDDYKERFRRFYFNIDRIEFLIRQLDGTYLDETGNLVHVSEGLIFGQRYSSMMEEK
jgi:hypothetical protein